MSASARPSTAPAAAGPPWRSTPRSPASTATSGRARAARWAPSPPISAARPSSTPPRSTPAGGGALPLGGDVGLGSARLNNLTVNGLTRVGAHVHALGAVRFNGAVRVFADSSVDTGSADLRFTSTIDSEGGAHNLSLA